VSCKNNVSFFLLTITS